MSPTSVIDDDTSGKKEMFLCGQYIHFLRIVFVITVRPLNLCDNTKDIERVGTYK